MQRILPPTQGPISALSEYASLGILPDGVRGRGHLYAFDPRRVAILLIAGDKTGDNRWYQVFVPRADDLYDEHLKTLEEEGLI